MSNYIEQPAASQDKAVDLKNTLGQVATAPFYIWANDDCANKANNFKEAKAIRLTLFNEGGESVHIVDADGVEVVDAEIEAHEALVNAGYFAGARKPEVKPEFHGAFMVNDPQDPEGFAIVGDDIASLILEARDRLIEPASEREMTTTNEERLDAAQGWHAHSGAKCARCGELLGPFHFGAAPEAPEQWGCAPCGIGVSFGGKTGLDINCCCRSICGNGRDGSRRPVRAIGKLNPDRHQSPFWVGVVQHGAGTIPKRMSQLEESPRSHQDRADRIVLRFNYPSGNSVVVDYKRYDLINGGWVEGHQRRALTLQFNDQCLVVETVEEVKRAADALAISFGDQPSLEVQATAERLSLGGNWFDLAKAAAQSLGWKLVHPTFMPPIKEEPGWSYD